MKSSIEEEFLLLFDPIETWKRHTPRAHAAPAPCRTSRSTLIKTGECVYESPKVMDIREYRQERTGDAGDESARLVNPHRFMWISPTSLHMNAQLLDSYHYTSN
ncbi:MAG: hypothetical protein ACLTR6_10325 [Clostridium fessum]